MIDIIIYSLITYALLAIMRSDIIAWAYMDDLNEWLLKKKWFLIHDGINCDECLGFWIVAGLCASHLVYLLPVYGAVVFMLRCRDGTNRQTD